ncbi:MAG: cytochrome b [Rhodanobacteraceae bacterium]|jgi:cytochrome b561|nr:cytochrome b [Rhodanobacteraceae bacterium]
MPLKSDANRWGSLAKLFHWTIVLLILAQGVIGLVMVELPKKPNIIPIYTFHKSLGLTILALAILRLTWRLFDRRPAEPAAMPRWQVLGARGGHALLYGLLFAVPLSGWWFDSASSLRPLYWWGLVKMPSLTGGGADKALKELAQETHETLFWLLVLVAAGHAAMALAHHFYNRDDVLRRMLPGRRASATPTR